MHLSLSVVFRHCLLLIHKLWSWQQHAMELARHLDFYKLVWKAFVLCRGNVHPSKFSGLLFNILWDINFTIHSVYGTLANPREYFINSMAIYSWFWGVSISRLVTVTRIILGMVIETLTVGQFVPCTIWSNFTKILTVIDTPIACLWAWAMGCIFVLRKTGDIYVLW